MRYIIYIMRLDEYNRVHQTLTLKKAYTLEDSFMIISYYFNSEEEVDIPIVPSKHGNAKHVDAEDFRPSAHSLKKSLKETVKEQRNLPPRMMRTEIEKKNTMFSVWSRTPKYQGITSRFQTIRRTMLLPVSAQMTKLLPSSLIFMNRMKSLM